MAGSMLEVSVRCGEKEGGGGDEAGKSEGIVVEMRLVMMSWRGWEGGGTSQREEPGIVSDYDDNVSRGLFRDINGAVVQAARGFLCLLGPYVNALCSFHYGTQTGQEAWGCLRRLCKG